MTGWGRFNASSMRGLDADQYEAGVDADREEDEVKQVVSSSRAHEVPQNS